MYVEKIVDITTGEETYRDYTAEEIAIVEAERKKSEQLAKELEKKDLMRKSALAKLVALGLTEDEIAAL